MIASLTVCYQCLKCFPKISRFTILGALIETVTIEDLVFDNFIIYAIKVFELLENDTTLRNQLAENTAYFKNGMQKLGFNIIDGDSAIVPVMLFDAQLSQNMADRLLEEGIYVIGFFYPVVPKGKARIRVQLSAAHTKEHLNSALSAFSKVGKELGIIQ